MKVTNEEHQGLLDKLAALLYIPPFDPETMVTGKTMGERLGVSATVATVELDRLVKAGQLDRIEVRLPNGKKGYAYVEK